ncbi:unnamed protein product [Microthlaspi erraticum]|uniref:SHSP domain-containing protein n=1 Tax=Microthlaspi erraticum TaxID=1685480 RepID=A0A6D2L2T3_9BRAS|nr:unnamed protein product [Microthlaspi erraticum]
MLKRPRPGGGRHPPPLAPTVSSFKPRAQWSNAGSSIFLYVNLPGFYRDQIEIKKDERTRTIQIQGQRPLSTQTKARFTETYRVPESCDMNKLNTSFSHGLLTIEFPAVVESEKPDKTVQDQGKTVQRPYQEESRGPVLNESSLGRKKPSDEEKQVGKSQERSAPVANKEEPKTYKSVVEGKRAAPTGSREKSEQKVKEGETSPSLARKERAKEEKVVERKEAAQMGQQKTGHKLKEEDVRSTPTLGGSLKAKVLAKEEKVIERKKDADIGQKKTRQKVEEGTTRTPIIGGSLEPKVHAKAEKVVDKKGNGETGQKLKEEKHTKPVVGDEARKTEKEIAATNRAEAGLKTKEKVERIAGDVKGNVKSKQDEKMIRDKVSEGVVKERSNQKKVEEAGLVKETGDLNDNPEIVGPRREDSGGEESTQGGKVREKMVEKIPESETGPLLVEEGKKKTVMVPSPESQKYDFTLINVGVAALVIMGFGAYVFVPLVKLFN